jgi:hypothetical protein
MLLLLLLYSFQLGVLLLLRWVTRRRGGRWVLLCALAKLTLTSATATWLCKFDVNGATKKRLLVHRAEGGVSVTGVPELNEAMRSLRGCFADFADGTKLVEDGGESIV